MTDTIETRWARHNEAGRSYLSQGDLARAEQAFVAAVREASAMGGDGLSLATSLGNLGQVRYRQRDFVQADALFRRALAMREQALGPDDYGLVQNINNLAALLYARGEMEQAEGLFRRALSISEAHLGEGHPDLAIGLNNLAKLYIRLRRFVDATPLLVRLASIREEVLGAHHPDHAAVLVMLARARAAQGEQEEAAALCRQALTVQEVSFPADDPVVAATRKLLGELAPDAQRESASAAVGTLGAVPSPAAGGDGEGEPEQPARGSLPEPEQSPEPAIAPGPLAAAEPEPCIPEVEGVQPFAAVEPTPIVSEGEAEPSPLDSRESIASAGLLQSLADVPVPASPTDRAETAVAGATPQEGSDAAGPGSDGWGGDARDGQGGAAGLSHTFAPDELPGAAAASGSPAAEGEAPTPTAPVSQPLAKVRHAPPVSPRLAEAPHPARASRREIDHSEDDALRAHRGSRDRPVMRVWPQPERRGRPILAAAAVLLAIAIGGWIVFGRQGAEAGASTGSANPSSPGRTAPVETQRPQVAVLPREESSGPAERLAAAAAEIGDVRDSATPAAGASDPSVAPSRDEAMAAPPEVANPVSLPRLNRIEVDGVSRAIATTKAHVDSTSRELPAEPIQFQRPPRAP